MKIIWLTVTAAVFAMAFLFAALANGDSAVAQTADTPTPEATAESSDDFGDQQLPPIEGKLKPPQFPNMDSNLNRIVQQAQTGQVSAQAAAANAPVHSGASVGVTLYITEGHTQDIWDWLEESGASPRNIGADYIEAYIPVSLLSDASQQEGVVSVRTIIPPQPAQGTVVSEGVAAHGASAWHNAGYKGQGVKIGIIDTGFEGFRGLMGTELPSTVEVRCYTEIGVFTSNLADCTDSEDSESTRKHGTAVTEAIFDIAPEATYYIANTSSWDDLIATAEWMVQQDVDVINHSVGWIWQGPGDGTSPFSNAVVVGVNTAVAGGITWVNSAGNDAKDTWFGRFSNPDFVNDGYHNFNGAVECNTVFIPELNGDEKFTAQLRWDDRWFGATRDLDLYLFDVSNLSIPVESSEDEQAGGSRHIPREILSYKPPSAGEYCLAVHHYRGFAPVWIQIQAWRGSNLEYHTIEGSIGNPAESANPGLLAVGAAGRNASVANPFNAGIIEPFSSQGPTPDGRTKPDIVGADAGQSVTYRSDRNPDGYFFGTSQASPHVAGLAALVKQRFPNYHPANITSYLKANAEARGAVPNNTWGYGFAKLPASDVATPTPGPTGTPQPTPDPSATAEPAPEPTATPEPTPQPTATPEPTPPPSSAYNIEDHACNADDLAHLDGYTLDSTFGPESYEADYTGVIEYYRSTFVADNGPTIVCLGTQYDSVANARWDSLNYSTVLQYAATAVDEIFNHEQAFVSSYIGEDTLGLLLDYEIDDSSFKSSEVIFLDAATLTVTTVRAIQSDSDDYPDISIADGIAKNIAARIIPDDTATQSSSSLLKLFGWLD